MVLAEEIVVPVEFITPTTPPLDKPPPVLPKPQHSIKTPVAASTPTPAPPVAPAPAPLLLAIADPTPSANAPVGVTHAFAPATAPAAAAPAVLSPSPNALHPAPKVEQPLRHADYLHNPKPKYPNLNIARNEQGTVLLSVLVGADGKVRDVKLKASSGFERLDRAARDAVLGWNFVPGKLAGGSQEMWYDLSMPFKLTE